MHKNTNTEGFRKQWLLCALPAFRTNNKTMHMLQWLVKDDTLNKREK